MITSPIAWLRGWNASLPAQIPISLNFSLVKLKCSLIFSILAFSYSSSTLYFSITSYMAVIVLRILAESSIIYEFNFLGFILMSRWWLGLGRLFGVGRGCGIGLGIFLICGGGGCNRVSQCFRLFLPIGFCLPTVFRKPDWCLRLILGFLASSVAPVAELRCAGL